MAGDRSATLLGVIHCSATPPAMDIGVTEINRWHYAKGISSTRGKSGYHGVIRRTGELELGREPTEIGAHAFGHNKQSVAVCLVGGVEEDGTTPEDNFTVPQWDTLKRVTDYWLAVWPQLILCGHRDLGAPKACPSFDVSLWLTVHYSQPFSEANSAALAKYLHDYRAKRDSQ